MTPVPVEDIDAKWQWIRKGLEQVILRARSDWAPEDVYLALKQKQAFLFLLGQVDGFVVVQRLADQRGPYLFVWAIYGDLVHIKDSIMASLREVAVTTGCRRLEMRSPRGWERAGLGWRVKDVIYEADIWKD